MSRCYGRYLICGLVLIALAGCGRSYFFGQRETWRHEAEVNCLKSGAVKASPALMRVEPIEGPGMCGADFPLKVAALGTSSALGYGDELRPPGAISGVPSTQPKWPIAQPGYAPPSYEPRSLQRVNAPPGAPLSIAPPGLAPSGAAVGSYDRPLGQSPGTTSAPRRPSVFDRPGSRRSVEDDEDEDEPAYRPPPARPPGAQQRPASIPLGRRPPATAAIGPVEVKPAATLACPIVSALDRWIMDEVQPAALRWFGQPVAEIKQISAYSCRGMNGQRGARISEHAFGNALDIAAFALADGRVVSVKDGWRGAPEEQGFLHDIQGAACQQFATVLAPGSNVYHYDHIHVDLMRRADGRAVCEPSAIPGEVVAARAAQARKGYARRGDPGITGSIAMRGDRNKIVRTGKGNWPPLDEDEAEETEDHSGVPGED